MPSRALSSAQPSRLQALETRHAALDLQLEDARKSPSTNEFYLRQLKKEKLKMKDEISKIHTH